MTGIYCIENIETGKKYIGQSVDIENRWNLHKQQLKGNRHYNKYLQRAWNKYGENAFTFSVLEKCEEKQLDEKERYYISLYKAFSEGYNLTEGGEGTRGYKHTDEYKNHMRYIFTGRTFSEETLLRMSNARKGKTQTITPKYIEGRKRAAEKLKGKSFSEEHRKKLSESHKGKTTWNKGMKFEKEAHPMYGKHLSEETRLKISNATKGRKNSQKQIEISSKKVLCVETGVVYSSITEAAKNNNVSIYAISNVLRGKSRTSNNYHWKYAEN